MQLRHRTRTVFATLAAAALLAGCGNHQNDNPVEPGNGLVNHTFTYVKPASAPAVTSVNLAGSMNGWSSSATAMTQKANGSWQVIVPLAPGTYMYKFVMNGSTWPNNMCNDATWGNAANGGKIDAAVTTCADDGNGGQNAVLTIQ